MATSDGKNALLAGASGLVGGYALNNLLESAEVARVIAVSRRPLGREDARLANRIVQFDRLEAQLKGTSCDFAFCCLGTTLRKAGSQQAFRAVDFDAVLSFARAARAAGARRFVLISSVGANEESKNFYLRTKGETERALETVGFESLDILQPSLLLSWRGEMRPLELLGSLFMPLVNPLLTGKYEDYRAISARVVGAAMLGAVRVGRRGVQRYTYDGLLSLARLGAGRARSGGSAKSPAGSR
jgi:uncharacterized protein YbjT (DUF2867 family)